MKPARAKSRPTELTRASLIEAAISVFVEHGYAGGSVRLITQKAKANQAAITYHFGGKEGLYREVLVRVGQALDQQSLITLDDVDRVDPHEAVRLYMRQYLLPLVKRDQASRFLRVLAWESVRPSTVFRDFIKSRPLPVFMLAERIARRFLPESAPPSEIAVTTLWLAHQPFAFVRDADLLSQPPWSIQLDREFVDQLVEHLTRMSLKGLSGTGSETKSDP